MKCPLTGLECNKIKNIPIVEKFKDDTNIMYLCEECADIYILNKETEKEIEKIKKEEILKPANEILKNMMKVGLEFMQQYVEQVKAREEKSLPLIEDCCSFCGSTSSDINQAGRLGCMYCYDHFGPEIISSIQNYHGANKHIGKVPDKWKLQQEEEKRNEIRKNFTIEVYIKQLEEITKTAIKKEQYEMASICRDKLKEILKLQSKHRNLTKKISETSDEQLISEIKEQIQQIEDQCFTDWSQATS